MSTNSVRSGGLLRRFLPIVSALALTGAVTLLLARPAEGNPPSDVAELKALHDIEDLEYCYAAGTDAIGRGDLVTGKQIYAKCFTPNAPVVITQVGGAPGDPPAVSVPSAEVWADLIDGLFADAGYVSTQHKISNVRIDILPGGNTAKITSYLTATHVYDPVGSIQVSHGTYESEAVKTPSGWRLSKRLYHTLTFLRLDSPPAP
jgi:SnoaL-like protein